MRRTLPDLAATAAFAIELATLLPPGTCLALEGELGAGKTTLTRSLVAALGGRSRDVSSPTFALIHRYDTPQGIVNHLDAYRLRSSDELIDLGFDELLEGARLTIVEWPTRVAAALPTGTRWLHIEAGGETRREIELRD